MDLEISMKPLNRSNKDFILILGHGRSGTTLCASLLNMVPGVNIGLEINNNKIGIDGFKLPYRYTGNKIVPHAHINYDYLIKAFTERKWIIHKRYKNLKVIFTERDSIEILLSQYKRQIGKIEKLTIIDMVNDFLEVERRLNILKEFFGKYYIFDFNKAVLDIEERISLFRFCGITYKKEYSDNYIGVKPYVYGSIDKKNILFGRKKIFPSLAKKISMVLEKERSKV
jgi:hypothetical protein